MAVSDEPPDDPLWLRLFARHDRLFDLLFGLFFLVVGTALAVFWVVGMVWAIKAGRWLILAELVGVAWLFGGVAFVGWKWLSERLGDGDPPD